MIAPIERTDDDVEILKWEELHLKSNATKNHMKCLSFVGCFADVNGNEPEIWIANGNVFVIQPYLMDETKLLRERYRQEFLHLLDDDELF